MRSKRVPDRVHVVRPPEKTGDGKTTGTKQSETRQIALMLAQISDKLKRSEAERFELLNELRQTKKTIRHLEDKAESSEKAFLSLETQMQSRGLSDGDYSSRQAKFEKTLKATEEKMVKAIAGQALIDKRLQDTEEKQIMINQQLEKSFEEQKRIDHLLESNLQDKSRLLRKMERLEEIVNDTQDSLRAKAMVLLTDESAKGKAALQAPAWGKDSPDIDFAETEETTFGDFSKYFSIQNIAAATIIIAAILTGWAVSQMQQSDTPQIAVLENGGMVRLDLENNRWEPVSSNEIKDVPGGTVSDVNTIESQKLEERLSADVAVNVEPAAIQPSLPDDATVMSDEQLLSAFNADPDALAEKLNNIEPGAIDSAQEVTNVPTPPQPKEESLDISITTPVKNFDQIAYLHDQKTKDQIASERPTDNVADRILADTNLPSEIKKIELQAFNGNGEAQHDLAAIYTAGHGGVRQNFEKAAQWFWASAENNVANAKYNLGVLNHQGLGMERNLDKALYWYREAAKQGHAEARYNLGIAHIEGIGTNYDPALAAGFFERAANAGIVEAAYNLGLIHENGLLGQPKLEEALLWYHVSAKQGNLEAQKAMETIAKELQIGVEDIDPFVERLQEINESVKGRRAGPDIGKNAAKKLESQQVITAQIQEYLMLSGDYEGPADGINGPNTKSAILAYQAANNMQTTGEPSKLLLNHMVSRSLSSNVNNY